VWVLSFEVGNLIRLRSMLDVHLVQLLSASGAPYDFVAAGVCRTSADLVTPAGLREIAGYADVIGPDKNQIDSARAPAPVTLATPPLGAAAEVPFPPQGRLTGSDSASASR
jgi:glycerophosphoryl diester phosphodiesterase